MNSQHSFNPKIHRVTNFKIIKDYTIRLNFEDGTQQIIDFEPILTGPIFGPLRDKSLFGKVRLEENFGTLEWPNGADISPNVLYDWPDHVEAIVARRQEEMAPP